MQKESKANDSFSSCQFAKATRLLAGSTHRHASGRCTVGASRQYLTITSRELGIAGTAWRTSPELPAVLNTTSRSRCARTWLYHRARDWRVSTHQRQSACSMGVIQSFRTAVADIQETVASAAERLRVSAPRVSRSVRKLQLPYDRLEPRLVAHRIEERVRLQP
jgi:hypothetical protein